MSHFLDRLNFLRKTKETFSAGHGAVVAEGREFDYMGNATDRLPAYSCRFTQS